MNFVLNAFDGMGRFFGGLSDRIESLLDEKNKIRFLWILIGFLVAFGVADNRTAVVKIWEATSAQGVTFGASGERIEAQLNVIVAWVASLALTIFFWVCEANLILGWREPEEAHARFQEANQFRLDSASSNAPDAAEFYYSALMHGELFDIRVAKAVGIVAFLFDIAIQWQNRVWGGSNIDLMISAVHALLMLVGTELLMVLIRVVRRRSYPASSTKKASNQGNRNKSRSNKSRNRSKKGMQEIRYGGETYIVDDESGQVFDSQGKPVDI